MREVSKKRHHPLGWLLVILQAGLSVLFVFLLYRMNILPGLYLAIVGGVLGFLWIISCFGQSGQGAGRVIGTVYTLIITILLGIGITYVQKTSTAMDSLLSLSRRTEVSRVSLIVLKSSDAQIISDAEGCDFAIQDSQDPEDMADVRKTLKEELSSYSLIPYEDYLQAAEGLYAGEVEVLVLNENARKNVKSVYPDFDDETRILGTLTFQREKVEQVVVKDVSKPFVIYISGNDSYGEVSADDGRSDVNILCCVNPQTKEALLVTTPRDYYIDLPYDGEYYKDKLTHASLYGLDVSEAVLSDLYGIDIDYYVRVNFSGFQNIVDALGGVEVYSDYDFTTIDGSSFVQGYNSVNGAQALSFVRERYSFSDGDYQRGRNQMHMIQAIIDKITSPAILVRYLDLLDTLDECFVTDMPSQAMSQLVKNELGDHSEWNIQSFEVHGWGNELPVFSQDWDYASVQEIDEDSVEEARQMMLRILGQSGE